jgi:hypothetical protein
VTRKSLPFPLLAVVAAAAALALWTAMPTPPAGPSGEAATAPDAQQQLDALREELRGLRRQQAALGRKVDDAEARGAQPAGEDLEAVDVEPAAAPVLADPEAEAEHGRRQLAALSELVETEQIDSRWARQAETSLREAFDDIPELAGVHVTDARCASTACRIRFGFDEGDAHDNGKTLQVALLETPWAAESYVHVPSEGASAVVYLAREGHRLPRVDPI